MLILFTILFCFILGISFKVVAADSSKTIKNSAAFIENKGQIIDQNNNLNPAVLYLLKTPGMNIQLRKGGFSYDLYSFKKSKVKIQKSKLQLKNQNLSDSLFSPFHHLSISPCDTIVNYPLSIIHYHRIDFDLPNSNPNCEVITSEGSPDYLNYYTTGTSTEGVTNVRSYKSVVFKNIYPDIDLEFLIDKEIGFKYNFIVYPGGRVEDIQLHITDPDIELTPDGSLKAWAHAMNDYDPSVSMYPSSKSNAFSVRCLKDN